MHVSLRAGAFCVKDLLAAWRVDGSSSKYAEPDADGVKPVLRTKVHARISTRHESDYRSVSGDRCEGPTNFSDLIRCSCKLCRRNIFQGIKHRKRSTTRGAIDATSIRHATSNLDFMSRIGHLIFIQFSH